LKKETKRIPLSVLISTKNEERNIAGCIESVLWADEIYVFDSLSSDRTVEIAQDMKAIVIQREFDDFSTHKNWALENIPFNNEWILIIDADEQITEELKKEICNILHGETECVGFYIARQNWFAGKWVRHGGWYPDWQLRLFKHGFARYESRLVHEHMIVNGVIGYLGSPLLHYDHKGIERFFDRLNVYSSMEAIEKSKELSGNRDHKESLQPDLLAKGPQRRRFLKNFSYRYLPARPLFKFIWMYIFKLGFLDGRIGFRYCLLHIFYEYQVSLKYEELKDKSSPLFHKYKDNLV